MRRLTDERGAVAVIVALLLVVLLGMGALVVDVGAMYQEHRELQNGTDAAALAIAENCARDPMTCDTSHADATAATYVNGNARDGATAVDGTTLDLANRTITVNDSTKTSSGATSIAFNFAQVLGFTGKHLTATSVATWGYPSSYSGLPLTIDSCNFYEATHGGTFGSTVYLTFHRTGGGSGTTGACPANPAGQDFPGGFGWLSSTNCSAATTAGQWAPADTGNDTPAACDYSYLRTLVNTTIAVPVYDDYQQTGNNGRYHLAGYGAFYLKGYDLGHGPSSRAGDYAGCANNTCLKGYFTQQALSGGTTGGTVNFGVYSVSLKS